MLYIYMIYIFLMKNIFIYAYYYFHSRLFFCNKKCIYIYITHIDKFKTKIKWKTKMINLTKNNILLHYDLFFFFCLKILLL